MNSYTLYHYTRHNLYDLFLSRSLLSISSVKSSSRVVCRGVRRGAEETGRKIGGKCIELLLLVLLLLLLLVVVVLVLLLLLVVVVLLVLLLVVVVIMQRYAYV